MSTDAGRGTIATLWSPTTGIFSWKERSITNLPGVNKAEWYHEEENARIQDQLDHVGASPGRTGSIDPMILFAVAQNRTMQEGWEAVQALKTPKRIRMVIGMKKR